MKLSTSSKLGGLQLSKLFFLKQHASKDQAAPFACFQWKSTASESLNLGNTANACSAGFSGAMKASLIQYLPAAAQPKSKSTAEKSTFFRFWHDSTLIWPNNYNKIHHVNFVNLASTAHPFFLLPSLTLDSFCLRIFQIHPDPIPILSYPL